MEHIPVDITKPVIREWVGAMMDYRAAAIRLENARLSLLQARGETDGSQEAHYAPLVSLGWFSSNTVAKKSFDEGNELYVTSASLAIVKNAPAKHGY